MFPGRKSRQRLPPGRRPLVLPLQSYLGVSDALLQLGLLPLQGGGLKGQQGLDRLLLQTVQNRFHRLPRPQGKGFYPAALGKEQGLGGRKALLHPGIPRDAVDKKDRLPLPDAV